MINSHVLVSSAAYFSNQQPINPYYGEGEIDVARAAGELEEIANCLREAGIQVTRVEAPSTSQDGVYTANWALIRGKTAVLSRLPKARKSEEKWAENILSEMGYTVHQVPNNWRFSGQGDALACGDYLFCGSNYRSDVAAQTFAADVLGFHRIQLETVPQIDENGEPVINQASGWPDSFYYDIDLALSIIKPATEDSKGLIAYCPEAFIAKSRQIIEELDFVDRIEVSEAEVKEAFACNLVSTGETVIMSAYAPELRSDLEGHGLKVLAPKISELAKGGGYIRCTSLWLDE